MSKLPPKGSSISKKEAGDQIIYSWAQPNGGILRYLFGFFFIFWVCGWLTGMVGVLSTLIDASNEENPPILFLCIWMVGMTAAGLFATFMSYRILRPGARELLAVSDQSITYDSGDVSPLVAMMPFCYGTRSNPFEPFNQIFRKRRILKLSTLGFAGFVFENVGTEHRLYFDEGADRILIGEFLREPDREWLATELSQWRKT